MWFGFKIEQRIGNIKRPPAATIVNLRFDPGTLTIPPPILQEGVKNGEIWPKLGL